MLRCRISILAYVGLGSKSVIRRCWLNLRFARKRTHDWAVPEEIIWPGSDEASFIIAATLMVDGGLSVI